MTNTEQRAREVLAQARLDEADLFGERCADKTAIRAMLAFKAEDLESYEKFDGVGPHAETIETRARIGERYLECYESALSDPRLAGYAPADCPSELLLDILGGGIAAFASPPTTGGDVTNTELTRPIIGIANRTAQEVFDIMCDRIRFSLSPLGGVNCPRCGHRHPSSYHGACVNCGAEEVDLAALAAAQAAEEAPEPKWGSADTVGNFIAQLRTIDPSEPIFAGFHIRKDDGQMLSKVRGLHISWEHVTDRRHITGRKGEGVRTLVAWAGEPAPTTDPVSREAAAGEGLRPEVLAFAHLMECQLRANDHKPGWKRDQADSLMNRVSDETAELREAIAVWQANCGVSMDDIGRGADPLSRSERAAIVGREAADVANFAMMIADVCGALRALPAAQAGRVGESSDSADYDHTFYGILNAQGKFWTPLPFHDEAAAKAHLSKWAVGDYAKMAETHKIVPVRVQLTAALSPPSTDGEDG